MNRALLDLQELDSTILSFAREKARLDNGQNARKTRDDAQNELETAQKTLKAQQSDLRAREDALQNAETKIALQKKRLMNTTSSHEISAFERDIIALENARGDLDEAILNLMDAIETSETALKNAQTALRRAERELEEIETHFASESARLDKSIAAGRARRPVLADVLSAGETEKYNAVFKKFGGLGVAKMVGADCSACGTTNSVHHLREAKTQEFPICESCGRLLFVG